MVNLFCAHKVPIVVPIIQDAITPHVAIYVVTNALSHHGLSAINNANPPATKAERIPPII